MPVGSRIRANNVFGVTTDNPLTIAAITFNSAGLANLPVVSGNHAIVTLDPLRQFGAPEIVVITSHTAAATVATITRGAYGTTARAHPVNTVWVHAPITEDVIPILTSSTRPADPYNGERIFETDTNRFVARSTAAAWQQDGLFFDPPACQINLTSGSTLINDNTLSTLSFTQEVFDTDSMHSTVSNTSRITFNTAGLYIVTGSGIFSDAADYQAAFLNIRKNGTTVIRQGSDNGVSDGGGPKLYVSGLFKFAATDFVELMVFNNNTANAQRSFTPTFEAIWVGRGN